MYVIAFDGNGINRNPINPTTVCAPCPTLSLGEGTTSSPWFWGSPGKEVSESRTTWGTLPWAKIPAGGG